MLVIVKPLLVECVVAVLALNIWNWNCGMMFVLMVGQICLGHGLEGAARLVAVQSNLIVNELLLTTMLLLIFTTLLIAFGWWCAKSHTLGHALSRFQTICTFKVTGLNVIPPSLLSSSRMLPTSRGTHDKLPRKPVFRHP